MHKSAMQMHAARDLQRGTGVNNSTNGNGGLAAAINPNNISNIPGIMGTRWVMQPYQTVQSASIYDCEPCRQQLNGNQLICCACLSCQFIFSGEIKPHQCQQCMKSFSSNHQLVQHIRVHTGEKPYKCSYCDRRFKQLSHVQQHTRLHTGNKWSISFYWVT